MKVEIYDVETISNFFSYVGFDINTKEYSEFIIHDSNNQLIDLINHLNNVTGLIGYNNLNFDSQVIQYIQNNYTSWLELNGKQVSNLIYQYAQKTISKMNTGEFPEFLEWKLTIKNLDLFKIWHYDNKNKRGWSSSSQTHFYNIYTL